MARVSGSNEAAIALRTAAHAKKRTCEEVGPQPTAEAVAAADADGGLFSPVAPSQSLSSGIAIGHYKAVYGVGCPMERARRRQDGSPPASTAAAPGA